MDRAGRERLMAGLRWIGARDERRLVEVVIAPQSREMALAFVAIAEHEGELPHVVLEAPWTTDGGFALRADEVLLRRDEMADAARRAGGGLRDRNPPKDDASLLAVDRFVRELADLLDALPAALGGLVVVLAPRFVEDSRTMADAVELLVASPLLSRVRWVVLAHAPALGDLAARMGGRTALRVDAIADERAAAQRLADDLERAALAPAGAPGATYTGAASPRGVSAPVRRTSAAVDPLHPERAPLPALAQPATTPPEVEPTLFEQVRALTLRAAASSSRGNFIAAIPLLREARDLCFLHGRNEDAIRVEIMLASYIAAAGGREQAILLLEAARAHAQEAELPALGCQVELARASMLSTVPDLPRAAAAFADAGSFAEVAEQPLLALEGYRLSGEAALAAGLEPQAAEAWAKALAVSGDTPDPTLTLTTAEIAERLAAVCAGRGLSAQAASLRARAEWLRAPRPPDTAAAASPPSPMDHPPFEEHAATVPIALPFTPTPQGITPPTTSAFREVAIADVPRNRVPAELKGTLPLDDSAPRASDEEP